MLDYVDQSGKRRQVSLGHADKRQAERQGQEKELELRVNVAGPAPLRKLKPPKAPRRKVRVFTDDECDQLCVAARQYEEQGRPVKWELLIRMCLGTGMRRGELMNTTWRDVDFANMNVEVSPKKDREDTWE